MDDRNGRDHGDDHRRHHHDHHDHHRHDGGGDRRGPPESEWLQLEMSKVLQGSAEGMARAAAEEIIRDAIKARLRERLGPRLEAVGRLVADQLADDVEQNLDIEGRIGARSEARRALGAKIAEALGLHTRDRDRGAPPDPAAGG